ncbi:hypothetical protein [Saccharothrix syringae]|uniref:hypothetical protein n=1 Tax=Saccharothrix syringae TaxID=103733 RepID=UPI000AED561E|nr:hypothetical protein [Saccharothrix syringae]
MPGLGSTGTKDIQAVERLRDNGQLAHNGLVGACEFTSSGDTDIENLVAAGRPRRRRRW